MLEVLIPRSRNSVIGVSSANHKEKDGCNERSTWRLQRGLEYSRGLVGRVSSTVKVVLLAECAIIFLTYSTFCSLHYSLLHKVVA